ncbi:MAG: DUF1573 domain-containing protein, partial [Bacteroidota bacterium]
KKHIILFTLLLFASSSFLAAQGIMDFDKETHDFGNIDEGTVATYEFEFTNTGDQPIEISSVKASCGCTTPFWTKEVVYPGKTGKIKASYNSKSRPGPFTKSVTIRSNAKKNVRVLYIKGFVNPSETSLDRQEGKAYGNATKEPKQFLTPPAIRLEKDLHDYGKVEIGQTVRQRFKIYNGGQTNLVITGLKNQCDCVSFGLSSGVIRQNSFAILEISLQGDKIQAIDEEFLITSNDPKLPQKAIRIKGNIVENFSKHLFRSSSMGNENK